MPFDHLVGSDPVTGLLAPVVQVAQDARYDTRIALAPATPAMLALVDARTVSNTVVVAASDALRMNTLTQVSALSDNMVMSLPTPDAAGNVIVVEKIDSSPHNVSVTGTLSGIAGSVQVLSLQNQSMAFVASADGSWYVAAGFINLATLDARYQTLVNSGGTGGSFPTSVTITYNPDSTIASETEFNITTTFAYNGNGTVASDTRLGVTRNYTYAGGKLISIATDSIYTYNADNSLATATENGVLTSYTYNTDGSVRTDQQGAIIRNYTYDALGNLIQIGA